jgi:tetratricopeptide (TPR) repeat protein
MGTNDDNGGRGPSDSEWEAQKQRDDTPSFIRNVQARAEMLNPSRGGADAIPVLTMPSSIRIWRKIRWPLLVVVVVAILAAVGLFTNDRLEARSVKRRIAEAAEGEAKGTVESLIGADQMLGALADRHSGRVNAQVARAWQAVLNSELLGPKDKLLASARQALERAGTDTSSLGFAARAGVKHGEGDFEGALELAGKGLGQYATQPRLHLVKAWALRRLDKGEEAAETLMLLRKLEPNYMPALHTQLSFALADGDRDAARELADELLEKSPGNLFASLVSVDVRLPRWGEPDPDLDTLAGLIKDSHALDTRVKDAPPDLAILHRRLSGRVKLLTGELREAVADLKYVSARVPDAETLAWRALAIRELDGPVAALAELDSAGKDIKAPEILDVRVRCLLDHHHVDQAGEIFAALEASAPSLPSVRELKWILSVRRGDLAGAVETLPKRIDARLRWVALEMYELLRSNGDVEGRAELLARMKGATKACADGIGAWHEGLAEATAVLGVEGKKLDPCIVALKAKLLRGHMAPAKIKAAAERANKLSGGDLRLDVDRALAVWLVDGQAAAAQVLDGIWKLKPQGALIRWAMGEAFLQIGLPARALEVVEGMDNPMATYLRLHALEASGNKKQFDELLGKTATRAKEEPHPALAYWAMRRDLDASGFDKVITRADAVLPQAGRLTAEIAELKAKALNSIGSRGDADRALDSAARAARTAVGLDEVWQAKLSLIRLNLRRGGAFLFKAVAVTTQLYKDGLKNAELSYSYAVANIRQGNERGAMRYLRESLDLDPSFVPAYTQLQLLGKLSDEQLARLGKVRPGAQP